jgi:hypothetical protein
MSALPPLLGARNLPGFRLQAKGKERSTFIFTGGYDSFVEEFYNFLLPLTELGITVIAFDGPGQGGALRQGIYLDHAWEKPAKAAIDHFELDAVDWLGASCGGYMSIRAAAFEPRGGDGSTEGRYNHRGHDARGPRRHERDQDHSHRASERY